MTDTHDNPAAAPDQPQAAPINETGGRIASLDFIRGIAVMGILVANIVSFGQPFTAYMWPDGFLVPDGDPGGWQWIAQFVAIDGKMRGLFSLLFGAGICLFMERAWDRGKTRWLQARRLFWLGLFGLAHFFLLWRSDILFFYSLCGFVLLATLRWTPKTQIVVATMVYSFASVLFAALYWFMYRVAETPWGKTEELKRAAEGVATAKVGPLADAVTQTAIMQDGTYLDLVLHKLTVHGFDWVGMLMFVSWETVPLMLFGAALYRLGLFDGRMNASRVRLWGWLGVIGGSAVTLAVALWVKSVGFGYFSTMGAFIGWSMLPRLFVVIGLAALLSLYGARAGGWLALRIAATGRMAFSNYLGTSFVLLFVFSPWAFDLFGVLNRPQLYAVVLGVWALMLLWSKPWLERFRYGPLEWLWRCLTYGRAFPLRR
ncbi:MAG: DUF418 domain-containing protein [Sphingomonadaceae bacterium]